MTLVAQTPKLQAFLMQRPRPGNDPILQGPAERFPGRMAKLGQRVEEEHTAAGKASEELADVAGRKDHYRAIVGTVCWVACFLWIGRISSRQDRLLEELHRQSQSLLELNERQAEILREVHPDVGEIRWKVEQEGV